MIEIKEIIDHFRIPIKEILIAPNLSSQALSLLEGVGFLNKTILLVADANTYPILGDKIFNLIAKRNGKKETKGIKKLILQAPRASQEDVLRIVHSSQGCDLIIAVGSGTINDLCKLASFRKNIPYVIFATAPSMNGYASANSSIEVAGRKTSIAAHLAQAIYLDLTILSSAPTRLIKAGIGDSICFFTCWFDWLLSHLLLKTPYNPKPFELLLPYYQKLINLENFKSKELTRNLAETLIVSGLGMFICQGSYPASQAEHLIAHYLEIKHPRIMQNSYHGEQIAVTTLNVAQIQAEILNQKRVQISSNMLEEVDLQPIFGRDLAMYFYQEIKAKLINKNLVEQINSNLTNNWQEIKKKLRSSLVKKNDLLAIYQKFSLPTSPKDIEINDEIYQEALNNAHLIRNRFTSLDFIHLIKRNSLLITKI